MKFNVTVKGLAPLLHDRFPEEDFVDKTKRSKKVRDMSPEEQCEKALFKDAKGIYIPTNKFWGGMFKMSTRFKLDGKRSYYEVVKGGLFITEEKSYMKNAKWKVFGRSGVNNNAGRGTRIMIYSPRFEEWDAKFTLECIDERAEPEVLKSILESAGLYAGIGGWHPRFGRFEITSFKEIK